jgi:ABC-type transporter Mla subunit MlaD
MRPTTILASLKWASMALVFVSLAACFEGTHDFTIRFSDVHGLQKGDPVYFEETAVGSVAAVDYTDAGRFRVKVALEKAHASAATDASRFYIDRDPAKSNQRLVRIVQLETGGQPIEEGAVVAGHTKYAVIAEGWARQLGHNMTIWESGINAFLKELQSITTEEQVAEIERQLDEIIAALGDMSRDMKRRLENDILPLLREKIEELRRILEKSGREEDVERLEDKMDAIDNGLRV